MTSYREGVEVVESGRALKVHTDTPHLVSLGGGRLSTAVTLHPLPQGRVTIGSGRDVDITVQGTGVEPLHCHIDNTNGVVTLHPIAEMTSVDGLKVTSATRLTQGTMLCIGRSNYLRFNHPAEARLMKSILPNARISMAPLTLYSGADCTEAFALERKPPVAPRRSPRDSWGDVSSSSDDGCVLGKVSRFEFLAHSQNNKGAPNRVQHFSPKVFPAGCPTANSPASAVLGPSRASPVPHLTAVTNGIISRSTTPQNCAPSTLISTVPNGVPSRSRSGTPTGMLNSSPLSSSTPVMGGMTVRSVTPVGGYSSNPATDRAPSGMSRSVTSSPAFDRSLHSCDRSLGSTRSLSGSNEPSATFSGTSESGYGPAVGPSPRLATPSPAFNRNPLPYSPGSAFRSVTPSPPRSAGLGVSCAPVGHRRTLSAGSGDFTDPNLHVAFTSSNCSSLEELTARNDELEHRRKQAQEARMREQETEKQERARLEEILTMCAEYERQAQCERQQSKPPSTPTLHQNRIKTNGSLPRDKRLASPNASAGVSEDEMGEIFTFETSSTSVIGSFSLNCVAVPGASSPSSAGHLNSGEAVAHLTATSPLPSNMVRNPYENVVIMAPGTIVHPQSPRTRIRTIAPSAKDTSEVIENRLAVNGDYEFVDSLPRRTVQETPSNAEVKCVSSVVSTALNSGPANDRGKFILPLANGSPEECLNDMVDAMVISNRQAVLAPSELNGEVKDVVLDGEGKVHSEVVKQKELVKQYMGLSAEVVPEQNTSASSQLVTKAEESQLQSCMKSCGDVEQLRRERGKLLATMSGLKRKVADIEQQEEELLRELDMERALLDGEWQAQSEKLLQEEERLSLLRERVAGLDEEMEQCHGRELQRQAEAKWRLEVAEREIHSLELEASKSAAVGNTERHSEIVETLKQRHELLEADRKAFEDLEFRQLEEEAGWLAGREELQRELADVAVRVETRSLRLRELDQQRLQAAQSAQEESCAMERQLLGYLRRLEEGRKKQRELEAQLLELTAGLSGAVSRQDSTSPDGSSDADELAGLPQHRQQTVVSHTKQSSQDDLDRISRVTSGAPIEIATGSLGRRTLESLQQIERNRQRHLAQQGSQVIEEERKRVQELKRRVQDEVRAQWEERRQREANCNSLNSVGSEESSLTSSDVPTESASSDDAILSPTNDGNAECTGAGDTATKNETDSSHGTTSQNKVRDRELEQNDEETRPLSDGSAYEQQLSASVRKRDKAPPQQQQSHQRPLTRYLPIRSESLNLRQHIESAGHQIELCVHVSLDSTSCRGHLHKMGSKFHHWNRRWFVFDRVRRTLTYYGDRGEKKPRGGVYFQSIEEVYVDHLNSVKSPNPQVTFVVKTNERTYHLMAPSPEAMRIWVDVIFTGAEGYQEFEHGS